jgi:NTE family protein
MNDVQKNHRPRKKVGLALGGGGAKGLVHIGVIKALEKAGIPIDFVAGTSMGALVGGWYAATRNIIFLENIFLKIKKEDMIPSEAVKGVESSSLFKSEVFAKLLVKLLDDKKIEQCSLPFRAVATNVENGQEVILSQGSLVDAIRASIALPVAFQPIKAEGRLLMDGGICNPVPANIVRQMGADFVIAVDVSSRWMRIDNDLADSKNAPSFIENAFSVMEYEIAQQVLKQADVVMRPPVMSYDWLEFSRAKEIIAVGVEEARRNMATIRKKGGYPKLAPRSVVEALTDFLSVENL